MGYGAFVHITNGTDQLLQVKTKNDTCMYGTGNWSEVIFPGQEYPSQYIEARASGACAFSPSSVEYSIESVSASGYNQIASLTLTEQSNNWGVSGSTENVRVDKIIEAEQAHMWFTITST
ncbi:hypothetical protein KCM76_08300 [Zooshikella marina]|uniref:hypothetical protein n=1 Tax=Zooshikella ganghwensis TaxID=202772 RepID=UPI001BAF5166|nr:hypothetical protein [Zooshikella ganghwensis]MBU2705981.1 hypothetical protein [Zooshikella ganghwensis]